MVKRSLELLGAMSPAATKVSPWTWGSTTFHLQHGTCRFGDDEGRSVIPTSDGGYLIAGFKANQPYLIKTNEEGLLQ